MATKTVKCFVCGKDVARADTVQVERWATPTPTKKIRVCKHHHGMGAYAVEDAVAVG